MILKSPLFPLLRTVLLALGLLLLAGTARADDCTATLTDINFGVVSPIQGGAVTATATGNVQCKFILVLGGLLAPNVTVCVNAGLGSGSALSNPRTMSNPNAGSMPYNLYRSASYSNATIWGGPDTTATPTPITLSGNATILTTTVNLPFTVYGQIAAGSALAATQTYNNADTVFSSTFGGTINYAFYGLGAAPACTSGASSSFGFSASATATNNCSISSSPVAFGTGGVLTSVMRAQGTLSVRCVNNNAYRISLDGGSVAANVAARRMKNTVTGDTVSYRLSASLDGALWGDGSGGTTPYLGTGTGQAVSLTMYGSIPVQNTPAPGDFKDTVTATVAF